MRRRRTRSFSPAPAKTTSTSKMNPSPLGRRRILTLPTCTPSRPVEARELAARVLKKKRNRATGAASGGYAMQTANLKINIPTPLRQYAAGQAAVDVEGKNVGDALSS